MLFEIEPIPKLLVLAAPFTIAVFLVHFIRRAAFRRTGPKVPPGPPGSDHAKFLQTDRWNVFKEWNERYGQSSPVTAVESNVPC
jgi:hypothetical protein